jgi:hypothetical protein
MSYRGDQPAYGLDSCMELDSDELVAHLMAFMR